MARIRTIKPEFWTDGDILGVSRDARLFYIGLWNFSDDNGVMEYNPLTIKAQIFPMDDVDVSALVEELSGIGKVLVYGVNGKKYLFCKNLKAHQVIDRPRKSNLPIPRLNQMKSVEISPGMEGKGMERKGMEGTDFCVEAPEQQALVATLGGVEMRFPTVGRPEDPKEWGLTEAKVKEYRESYPGVEIEIALKRARQWCIDNPTKRKTQRGMPAFLSRWLSREQDSPKGGLNGRTQAVGGNNPPRGSGYATPGGDAKRILD